MYPFSLLISRNKSTIYIEVTSTSNRMGISEDVFVTLGVHFPLVPVEPGDPPRTPPAWLLPGEMGAADARLFGRGVDLDKTPLKTACFQSGER